LGNMIARRSKRARKIIKIETKTIRWGGICPPSSTPQYQKCCKQNYLLPITNSIYWKSGSDAPHSTITINTQKLSLRCSEKCCQYW
jgi:hypothetical protein